MRAHIGVDADSGLVHTVRGTAANVGDVVMLPLFFGVLSSLLTRPFCAVPRTSVARIAWD